jgi:thiamine-monophosphate kinase
MARFFNGLQALASRYRITLAGGDTAESPTDSALADIVLLGSAPIGKSLRRSGARPDDALYVTGSLGGASVELSAMLAGRPRIKKVAEIANHPQMFPEPRIGTGMALLKRGLATACIDISDGLSTDLAHLCRASGVAAEVDQAAIPFHPLTRKLDPETALSAALHGGEDYELLFSAPASTQIPRQLAGIPITRIGRFIRKRAKQPLMTLIEVGGTRATLEPQGWEHFSSH